MDPNAKINVQVDPDEDTEWNDILRSKGIIPERPPSPTAQLEEALQEAIVKQWEGRLENKDLEELDELEGEEDEDFLEEYKQKRMLEMKALAERGKFGAVYPVTKPEYASEITDASKRDEGIYVFVHMSSSGVLQSRLLASLFAQAAVKYKEHKFVDIPAARAVENYPDSNCPTLLVYYRGDVLKQYVTLTQLGGNAASLKDLEKVLVNVGAVLDSDKRLVINSDEEEMERNSGSLRFVKKTIRGRAGGRASGSDDDDNDDFFD